MALLHGTFQPRLAGAIPAGNTDVHQLLIPPHSHRPLRIAQIAPLYESVPPKLYGGTERVVSYLTEELVAQGHDVTLFASGDSTTSARLVAITPQALRLDEGCIDQLAHHIVMLEDVFQRAHEFDILHFHIDYLHFPLSRRAQTPRVTTLHGRLDLPDLKPLYERYRDEPVVSISDNQRAPLPMANWVATVHHGLPAAACGEGAAPEGYLAFLGRISPEKGVERAVEIAQAAGLPLRVAAKIDRADRAYYERDVAHLFELPGVEYIGEIGEAEKPAFLAAARALLFPIDWEEPFGMVMIEAMACGTPVVAFVRGSVPEVLEDGVTGYLVDSVEEAIAALGRLDQLDRARCRAEFERRFTAARMARDYLAVYRTLLAGRAGHLRPNVST
jgi:glycosyltransferase involved in cell wall biosynthesis